MDFASEQLVLRTHYRRVDVGVDPVVAVVILEDSFGTGSAG